MTCDLERPCARCVKRDIGHLCHDEPRDASGAVMRRQGSETAIMEGGGGNGDGVGRVDMMGVNGGTGYATGDATVGDAGGSPVALQRPQTGILQQNQNILTNLPPNFDWNNSGVPNQFQDIHHLHPNYMFSTSEVNNEYNLLNDFLSTSLLDDGALYTNDDAQAFINTDPLLSTNSVGSLTNNTFTMQPSTFPSQQPQQQLQPSIQAQQQQDEISRPPSTHPSSEATRNKFYLTAADPAGLASAEDRLHKLLRAKYDAGMLKPFNYVRGYSRLNTYITSHLRKTSQIRILKQLDRFRPKFREAMKNLTDMQLVLVEMWFERSLMEYDRIFASMAIPACCWRRTGEIFRGNREMASLCGREWEDLRDGRMGLHELLGEESLVSYWEKFGAIAFDAGQKAILTSCVLKVRRKGGEEEEVKCCFSFTIRRDGHNM